MLKVLGIRDAMKPWMLKVSGILQSPGHCQCQGCPEAQDSEVVGDAEEAWMMVELVMLQSQGCCEGLDSKEDRDCLKPMMVMALKMLQRKRC